MGFLKGLGKFAGDVVGGTVGGALEIAGELAGNETLKNVGQGVHKVTATSGEILGSLADGAVTTVHGVVTKDTEKIKEGLGDAGNAVALTATGVGHAVKSTAVVTAKAVREMMNDDMDFQGSDNTNNVNTQLFNEEVSEGVSDVQEA